MCNNIVAHLLVQQNSYYQPSFWNTHEKIDSNNVDVEWIVGCLWTERAALSLGRLARSRLAHTAAAGRTGGINHPATR
jgi:hypothetical protein